MANIYEQAQQFRNRLLAGDRSAAAALTRSYGGAYKRIQTDLDSVRSRLQELREQGVPANEWQYLVTREGRLQVLRTRVLDEISTFGQQAQLIIGGAIGKATEQGSEAALAMMDTALPAGIAVTPSALPGQEPTALIPEEVRLATGAIERVTAATQPAGAITQLLAGLAPEAADKVSDALVSGIALGRNPRQIARDIRDALGGNLTRALTIARTETLRAYREASRAEYNANADVLDGWVWVADLSPRTCSACWAQHGSEHPLDEIMATHPNCRCTMAPLTKPWSELGFGDTPDSVRITPGRDEFKKLPAGDQRRILGDRTYDAWRGKQIILDDVVVRRDSPVWGPSASAGNVKAALRNAEARRAAPDTGVVEQIVPEPIDASPARPSVDMTDPETVRSLLRQVESEYGSRSGVYEGQLSLTRTIAQRLGYDALPEVIEDADWDDFLESRGLQPMFRGISPGRSGADDVAVRHAEQFLSGDLFVGRGIYGSGTYNADPSWRLEKLIEAGRLSRAEAITEARQEAFDAAFGYAGGDGAMLEMALKPGSRIVDYDSRDIQDRFRRWQDEAAEAADAAGPEARELRFQFELGGDFAQWAMQEGYDAIKIVSRDESYTVILNRGAVYVRRRIRTGDDFDE